MTKLAIAGLIILAAGVALCFFGYFWFGLILLLLGFFLTDLFREKVMAELSKRRGDPRK
jgi:multisubunit Na+/H+ antiporter MnhG subunit